MRKRKKRKKRQTHRQKDTNERKRDWDSIPKNKNHFPDRDIQSNDKWAFPSPSKSYLKKQSSSHFSFSRIYRLPQTNRSRFCLEYNTMKNKNHLYKWFRLFTSNNSIVLNCNLPLIFPHNLKFSSWKNIILHKKDRLLKSHTTAPTIKIN